MKINNRNSFKLRYDNRVKYIISLIFFIIFFFFIELTHPNHLAQYLKGKKKNFYFLGTKRKDTWLSTTMHENMEKISS